MSISYNKNSIVLIGNGESILKTKFGEYINKFENIVRINNFRISGYEKYIGNKTTIWFNGANQGLYKRNVFPQKVIVSLPSKVLVNKKNINYIIKKRINTSQFDMIPLKKILDYEKKVGHNRLTTGMYAIIWAIDNYKNVYIHGFDFFINSKGHYFDNKVVNLLKNNNIIRKGKKHNILLEKKICLKLLKQGNIYSLNKGIKL